jgi:quinohemoprotein ethanol dehydrogenase
MRRVSLVLLCFVLVVIGGAAASSSSHAAKSAITPAPAFTADQLAAPAGDNWLMHMASLDGNRYSSLTQVTPGNVATLKEAWHINLGTCATKDAACGSLESNAVVYQGTYYTQTPKGDVFALDAATGATLWHFNPQSIYTAEGFNVGTGGRMPGVAIGEGKVFVALRDGHLIALDQILGTPITGWNVEVLPTKKGGRLSVAPIYFNGLVLVGDSGGDGGSASNGMHAFEAATGREVWTWAIVPAKNQPGGDTWSGADNNYGGGAMWESPVIDPKLGLAIFGTGNPVPWNSRGPGKNLFTDSIVALNVYTGQLVWYYQTAHHDVWDSDLPNNGVTFTAKYKVPTKVKVKVAYYVKVKRHGKKVRVKRFKTKTVTKQVLKTRPGVAFVNKYGWTFVLDRETGKPLLPIKEVKVPTLSSPDTNNWPTQPVPQVDFVTDDPIATDGTGRNCTDGNRSQTNFYQPYATATDPILNKPFKIACVYDPYDTTQQVVEPFEEMDWPASSYSPENHTMITCGVSARVRGFLQVPKASQTPGSNGGIGSGIQGTGDTSTANYGNFTAFDVTTGKRSGVPGAWHQKWDAPCYSGSMNTASGLTFIGHLGQQANGQDGHGYLEAVDTKTGASLWKSAAMSAPVGAAPVTYTVNGKQYISVEVGGESHNDVSRPFGLTDPRRLRDDAIYTYALP